MELVHQENQHMQCVCVQLCSLPPHLRTETSVLHKPMTLWTHHVVEYDESNRFS